MNLTEEEAREIFPDGRGDTVDDADVEPHFRLARTPHGWRGTSGRGEWFVSSEQMDDVVDEVGRELGIEDPIVWDLFVDVSVSADVLNSY